MSRSIGLLDVGMSTSSIVEIMKVGSKRLRNRMISNEHDRDYVTFRGKGDEGRFSNAYVLGSVIFPDVIGCLHLARIVTKRSTPDDLSWG